MSARIVRTGALLHHGREVEINGGGCLHVALVATGDETEDARALAEARQVRVAIEPADAAPPAHGSPLDYLAELKGILIGLRQDLGATSWDQSDRAISRCLSLANTVSLAILAERGRR